MGANCKKNLQVIKLYNYLHLHYLHTIITSRRVTKMLGLGVFGFKTNPNTV